MNTRLGTVLGLAVLTCGATHAAINLRLGAVQPCGGRFISVDLYAESDSGAPQALAAMDVALLWNPAVLQLRGINSAGPYPYGWLFSGFQNDHNLDGLNDTWSDGNALYTAFAQLGGAPAGASPPPGLLVTTFIFRSLVVGTPTTVSMTRNYGTYTHTVVYDGAVPGLDVTGVLAGATFTPSPRGDTNCDGQIDFKDINPFVQALSDPAGYHAAHPSCDLLGHCDTNCDGVLDFRDINPFVAILSQ